MNPDTVMTFRPLTAMSLGEIAQAIGATLDAAHTDRPMGPISTDSRSIRSGEVFLAIKGESFDGHAFCSSAIERGAAALIVANDAKAELDASVPTLRVQDPLRAYGELARLERKRWGGRVIALSGSVGKTTTRRLLAAALAPHQNVLEPIRNYNNLIGLPQTLLRLEERHEVAVLELGMNQPGELERLAEIAAPDVAGLTRIGATHVGMFDSMEELIAAKLSLLDALPSGAPVVLNASCGNSAPALERFALSHRLTTFRADGRCEADIHIENVTPLDPLGFRFDLHWPGGRAEGLELRHFGRHLLEDIAAAAAFLIAAEGDPRWIAGAIDNFRTEPLRGEIIAAGPWTFVLDCYNAAPDSMAGALKSLSDLPPAPRLILVLADMLELGDASRRSHQALLGPIRSLRPVILRTLGPAMADLAAELQAEGVDARGFADPEALATNLKTTLIPGDRVFFKGSHSFALEKVAQSLAPETPIRTV